MATIAQCDATCTQYRTALLGAKQQLRLALTAAGLPSSAVALILARHATVTSALCRYQTTRCEAHSAHVAAYRDEVVSEGL